MSPRRPLVYQIDFTAVASGKRIASTKRRVRWRFGFANAEALAAGETGTACRGEEHDITFVWSLSSGKRLVLADGQEVHFSSNRSNTFDYSWTMKGNHVLKIVAYANPPMSPTPGFKQYDFFVDGQTFFSFPKLFRLGLSSNDPRAVSPISPRMAEGGGGGGQGRFSGAISSTRRTTSGSNNIAAIEAPHNPDEEELYLQEAIRQSLNDSSPARVKSDMKQAPVEQKTPVVTDLLDFGDSPSPAAPPVPVQNAFTAPSTNIYAAPPPSSDPWSSGYSNPPTGNQQPGQTGFGPSPDNAFFGGAPAADPTYGAIVPAPASNPYSLASATNPYGTSTTQSTTSISYNSASVLQSSTNQYGPPTTNSFSSNPYGAPPSTASNANPFAPPGPNANPYAPASTTSNPYAASAYGAQPAPQQQSSTVPAASGFNPPAPVSTNLYGPQAGYMDNSVPQAVTPLPQQTPSTLGFGSPPPEFNFSSPYQNKNQDYANNNEPEVGQTERNNNMNTNAVNGFEPNVSEAPAANGGLDQMFSKLVNLDTFSVASKKDEVRYNPFESKANSTIGGSRSLADIQKSKPAPRTDIMKAPAPPPGAMVVSGNQTSGYGSQYGVQPPVQNQMYGGASYGQQPPMSTAQYGGGMQQPQFGAPAQPPMMMQSQPLQYGQPQPTPPSQFGQAPPAMSYGQQQQQPPMQQPFMQQNTMQQQAPSQYAPSPYGQPPLTQSQLFF